MMTKRSEGSGAGGGGPVAINPTTHFHPMPLDSVRRRVVRCALPGPVGMAEGALSTNAVRHGAALGLKTAPQRALMTFPTVTGVTHLLPSTGEFAYDTQRARLDFSADRAGLTTPHY